MQINPGDMVAFGANTVEPTAAHSGHPARRTTIFVADVTDTGQAFLVGDTNGLTWVIGKEDPTVEITTAEAMILSSAHDEYVRGIIDGIERVDGKEVNDLYHYVEWFVIARDGEPVSVWRWEGGSEYEQLGPHELVDEWSASGVIDKSRKGDS